MGDGTGNKPPLGKWPRILLQSLLAGGFIFAAFMLYCAIGSKLAIASLGASAFIAFGYPAAESARTRYLMGGYLCGVCSGALCNVLLHLLPVANGYLLPTVAFCALAAFFTTFSMLGLQLQHPPSAALAVAMVTADRVLFTGVAMLCCMALLCFMRWLALKALGRHLIPK